MPTDLDDSWSNADMLKWREQVMPPLSGLSLACSVVALAIHFIFPRLRVFPRSVISWVSYYNIIFACYNIWKWAPGSSLHESWGASVVPGSTACKAGLFFDNFTTTGSIACNTLITLTIFLVVAVQVNMEQHPRWYYWSYLAYVILYPIAIGFAAALGFATTTNGKGGSCKVSNSTIAQIIRVPGYIFLGIQFCFIVLSMVHVRRILASVSSISGDNFPIGYLFFRFIATYLAQLFNILPAEIYPTVPDLATHAIFQRFSFASHAVGAVPDAIILVIGNVDFMNWVQDKIAELRGKKPRVQTIRQDSSDRELSDISTIPPEHSKPILSDALLTQDVASLQGYSEVPSPSINNSDATVEVV